MLEEFPTTAPDPPFRCAVLPGTPIKRVIHPVCERAGIPSVGWKDFRHTHATLLSDAGESIKLAQAQLGHSDLGTTLQVYTHVVPESQRGGVENLKERVLFPSDPKFEECIHWPKTRSIQRPPQLIGTKEKGEN